MFKTLAFSYLSILFYITCFLLIPKTESNVKIFLKGITNNITGMERETLKDSIFVIVDQFTLYPVSQESEIIDYISIDPQNNITNEVGSSRFISSQQHLFNLPNRKVHYVRQYNFSKLKHYQPL